MSWFSIKYRALIVLILLIGSFTQTKAQCDNAVSIRCVSVDTAGNVTLTWVVPSNVITCGWDNYLVFVLKGNTLVATVSVANQTSITIPKGSLPYSPNTDSLSFYIETNNYPPNASYPSNAVATIYLGVYNDASGIAELEWNAISKPLPQGSDQWYQIWREYNNKWTLVDSTKNLFYSDTIMYCDSVSLYYQIKIADSTICTSQLNVAGKSSPKFLSKFNPPPVVMDTVSVTPGGTVDISWSRSSKNNVIGYIIYSYNPGNGSFTPIDTVRGINKLSLLNFSGGGNPDSSILIFSVATLDSCNRVSAIDTSENTLLLRVKLDICEQTNTLIWNPEANFARHANENGIGGYNVFYSVNYGPFQLLASLNGKARSYVDSNLSKKEYRCYYVQVYDSAHSDTTASSNVVCDSVRSPLPPKNNYLRTASVILNTSSIQVVGYVDSSSGAEYYTFERSDYPTGGFSAVYTMNAPRHSDSISYVDNGVAPTTRIYYYRILTLDSCQKVIDSTNMGQTMLLRAVGLPDRINNLTWTDYGTWYDGPAYYMIYRSIDGINYSLLSPSVPYTNAGENTFSDNVGDIIDGQGTFYYYVKAVEDTNKLYPYPFIDTSLSNIAQAYQAPTIFIPDAFCPTGKNKIFKPVGVYISSQGYDLSILNRWGDVLFESTNPDIGWDGTYKGGKVVEQGVYVYLLTYTSSRGEYFQDKGTVLLIK